MGKVFVGKSIVLCINFIKIIQQVLGAEEIFVYASQFYLLAQISKKGGSKSPPKILVFIYMLKLQL